MGDWLAHGRGDPPWLADPLAYLLDPVAPETFFRDHYEQASLLVAGAASDRFADMLSLDTVDAFIDGADIRPGMLDMVHASGRIDPGRYFGQDGRAIPSGVAEEYLKGATIILPQLHESLPRLGQFCRALEAVLSCHVQTNVYLTPPGNQGFGTHYDNHDVFVIQLSGEKSWNFYGTPVATPYRGERFVPGRYEPGEVSERFTLKPGDCLYVPRGLMHDAPNAGAAPSLHITVGLIVKTWADLILESVSELALDDPGFRRALPAGFARADFDRAASQRRFAELTRTIAEKASMDSAFDMLAHNFLRDRRPQVSGVIASGPDALGDGDSFRRRPLVPFQFAQDGDRPVLVGPGGDLHFDRADNDALERALSGEAFAVADLSCPDPQGLLRRLWANGYLERA